jgi:hypothetical protein
VAVAELAAKPPQPPAITPSTPGYSEGYATGSQNVAQVRGWYNAEAWCDVYADPEYSCEPSNSDGTDQYPADDPAVVGCIAALHAQGIQ